MLTAKFWYIAVLMFEYAIIIFAAFCVVWFTVMCITTNNADMSLFDYISLGVSLVTAFAGIDAQARMSFGAYPGHRLLNRFYSMISLPWRRLEYKAIKKYFE